MKLKQIIILSSILGLVGCGSILGPQTKRATQTYQLNDGRDLNQKMDVCKNYTHNSVLYVSAPDVVLPYSDYKMYYSTESYLINSYAYSQWAIPVSGMVHQNMMQSITNACLFKGVSSNSSIVTANYRLISSVRIIRHEMNTNKDSYKAHLLIFNELINVKDNELMGSFLYDDTKQTDGTPIGFVKSSSDLLSDYDAKLVDWVAKTVAKNPE